MIRRGTLPQQILSNAGMLFVIAAFSRVLRLLVFIVVAGHLGLGKFGVVAFVVGYAEIFRVAADFGVDSVLIRRLAGGGGADRLLGTAAVLKALLALVSFALGLGLGAALGYETAKMKVLAIGLTALFISSGTNLLIAPFQSSLRAYRIAWTGIVASLIYFFIALAGVRMDRDVSYFILAGVLADLCGFLLAGTVFGRISLRWEGWESVGRLFREALPIGLLTIVVIGYGRAGLLMLDRVYHPEEVGVYALGLRIVDLLIVFAGALAGSVYSALARSIAFGQSAQAETLYRGLYRNTVATVTGLTLLIILASPALPGVLGPEYVTASGTLAVLASALVFMFANQISASLLLAAGRESTILLVAVWNLCFNVTLNLLLIPHHGAIGAAVALLLTEAGNTLLQSVLVWNRFRIVPTFGVWLRAAGACALALVFFALGVRVAILAVLVVYAGVLVWKQDTSVSWMKRLVQLHPDRSRTGEVT